MVNPHTLRPMSSTTPLIAPGFDSQNHPEYILVDQDADQVRCDGGGGALGHPLVYYSFAGKPQVECLYCDRIFTKR